MKQISCIVSLSVLIAVTFCKRLESNELNRKLASALKKKINPAVNSMHEVTGDNALDLKRTSKQPDTCRLHIEEYSEKIFTHEILKHRYNFVHLKLIFVNMAVNETKEVINKNDWIWTYKGEKGAHQYLFLPGDFGYLSFGLLWTYTRLEKIPIYIHKIGNCSNLSNLTVGENITDEYIGNALGNMTSKIAAENDNYNSSYWCYNNRVWLHSWPVYYGCKNSVCTFQTFEYRCCKFEIDFFNKSRRVECGKEHYEFGELWWMLPIIIGEACFAFYPLLLTKIGIKVQAISKRIEKEKRTLSVRRMATFAETDFSYSYHRDDNVKYRYISSKYSSPITFVSTVCSPLYSCDLSGPVISRLLRISIIILPMTLSTIRVAVDYIYAKDVVTAAVKKGALVGFSSIIAGPSEARKQFLYIFNGPVFALSIYVVFGCILIVFPRNFEKFLDAGFQKTHKTHMFLAKMPLKLKERLSGLSVSHYTGYRKIHKLFLAQIFMLLHWHFWRHAVKLFFIRWKHVVFAAMTNQLPCGKLAAVIFSVIVLPLYFIFSVIEFCLTILYFAFPVINCFFVVLQAFLIHYAEFFKDKGCFFKFLCYVLFLPMLILFCISWYIYCLLFFDGLWFLSKIAMFTYSGIIAYPKVSYGYIVLVFMAIYYVTESVHTFGENYRQLLKLSMETCERYQTRCSEHSDIRNKYGIKSDLFYMIVDRHLPRRNQLLITVLKFTSVITVLTISVQLLITFNKVQELSLVSHVFTVLFICAVPKIIKMTCMDNSRDKARRKLRKKILRTIADYERNRQISDRADSGEVMGHSNSSSDETCRTDLENEYHII